MKEVDRDVSHHSFNRDCAYCGKPTVAVCDGRRAPQGEHNRASCRLPMCATCTLQIGEEDFCRDHRADRLGREITLRYGGRCRGCRHRIEAGQRAMHFKLIAKIECLRCVVERERQAAFGFAEVA